MTMQAARVLVVFLVSLVPMAWTQQGSGQPIEYKAGQVWETDLHTLATILKVEDIPKVGPVIHVRVDKIPVQSCGGLHLTTTIDHIALTEKMMRESATDLVQEIVDIPDSYFESYKRWQKHKKHQILKKPLSGVIESVSSQPGPMICNWLPSRTG
jgi:hypothetical protein